MDEWPFVDLQKGMATQTMRIAGRSTGARAVTLLSFLLLSSLLGGCEKRFTGPRFQLEIRTALQDSNFNHWVQAGTDYGAGLTTQYDNAYLSLTLNDAAFLEGIVGATTVDFARPGERTSLALNPKQQFGIEEIVRMTKALFEAAGGVQLLGDPSEKLSWSQFERELRTTFAQFAEQGGDYLAIGESHDLCVKVSFVGDHSHDVPITIRIVRCSSISDSKPA